jgi:hypothetical protein
VKIEFLYNNCVNELIKFIKTSKKIHRFSFDPTSYINIYIYIYIISRSNLTHLERDPRHPHTVGHGDKTISTHVTNDLVCVTVHAKDGSQQSETRDQHLRAQSCP